MCCGCTRGLIFISARACRIFASKEECWDDVHILRRGDVVLFRGSTEFD